MHRVAALVAATATLACLVSGQDSTHDEDPNVVVNSVTFSGNGCSSDTNAEVVGFFGSSDLSTPSWLFLSFGNAFNVSIGPGTDVSDHTRNCQMHISLGYASDIQFSATEMTIGGYMQLDPSVNITGFETYYFSQDAVATTTIKDTLQGGGDFAQMRSFTSYNEVPPNEAIWSPCGANGILNVDYRLALTSSSSDGTGTASVADQGSGWDAALKLEWAQCPS